MSWFTLQPPVSARLLYIFPLEVPGDFVIGGSSFATSSWRITWGDGVVETFAAPDLDATHVFDAGHWRLRLVQTAETGESLATRFDLWIPTDPGIAAAWAGTGLAEVVYGTSGTDTYSGGAGGDTLFGYAGADTLFGQGGDDLLIGGDGNNTLWGGAGADTLFAGPGDDDLAGGNGDDWLADGGSSPNGPPYGSGRDTLNGGMGADTLSASADGAATLRLGNDEDADVVLFHLSRFKPYAADAPDIVAGFDPRHDRIHVVDMALAPIELRFGTETTLGSEAAAVIYDGVTGRLFMGVSLFGAAHVATIIGAPDLTAEHFVIA